jgi:acyl carrier protein
VFDVFTSTVSDACSWEDWQRSDSLQEWTAFDSMAILEFLVGLEAAFGIRFPPEDLEHTLFTHRQRLLQYLLDRGVSES